MTLIKPKALPKGATIGVVAPGQWMEEERLQKGAAILEAAGFKVVLHPQCFERDYRLAGTDTARATALHDFFKDPKIDGIMCARGTVGNGAARTVAHLDMNIIRENPKVLCGYSDMTLLLHAVEAQAGLMTFHGPMLTTFQSENAFALKHFKAVMAGETPTLTFPKAVTMREGTAEGGLTGGNLCLLTTLLGTPDDVETDGKILFIEDVDEQPYTLDRMLWHLHRAGKLKNIKALIVGEMLDIEEQNPENAWGHGFLEVIKELLPEGIPCVVNAPCGHGADLATFPLGVKAKLEVGATTSLTLLEKAVN